MNTPAALVDLLICTFGIMAMQTYVAWCFYDELSKKIDELRDALKDGVKP